MSFLYAGIQPLLEIDGLCPNFALTLIAVNVLPLCGFLVVFWLHSLVYGSFEPAESDELYAKFLAATLESILTVYLFNIDVNIEFLLLFVWLLAGSAWVWIGKWRVESLAQQPNTQLRTYEHTFAGLSISFISELLTVGYIFGTLQLGKNLELMTMLAFEHAVLSLSAVSTTLSFFLLLAETSGSTRDVAFGASGRALSMAADTLAENDDDSLTKRRWRVLCLDITRECIVLVLSLSYLYGGFLVYNRPILTRHLFFSSRSLTKLIREILQRRRALRDINDICFDATAEQISQSHICPICLESMREWQPNYTAEGVILNDRRATRRHTPAMSRKQTVRPKRLPCGLVLHSDCLQMWFERQVICPLCRRPACKCLRE